MQQVAEQAKDQQEGENAIEAESTLKGGDERGPERGGRGCGRSARATVPGGTLRRVGDITGCTWVSGVACYACVDGVACMIEVAKIEMMAAKMCPVPLACTEHGGDEK